MQIAGTRRLARRLCASIIIAGAGAAATVAMAVPASALSTPIHLSVTAVSATSVTTRATVDQAMGRGTVEAQLVPAVWNSTQGAYMAGPCCTEQYSNSATNYFGDTTVYDLNPVPGRRYMARTCFTPTGGSKTCSYWVAAKTPSVSHYVDTPAADVNGNHVTFGGYVAGPTQSCTVRSGTGTTTGTCNPRMEGFFYLEYGKTTSYTSNQQPPILAAARAGFATATSAVWLDPRTTYHYRACYIPLVWTDSGTKVPDLSLSRCGPDRTLQTGDAPTAV